MEDFPSNSKRPSRGREDPKHIERVVQSEVVRRKTPLTRRVSQNLLGGDAQSVWGFMFGDVLIPAARDMIADALTGGIERAIFGDSRGPSSRSRNRHRGGPLGHTSYDRYHSSSRGVRDEPRRELSRRARSSHNFDEIILGSRAEADEVLDRLEDLCDRYESATVANLYELVGLDSAYTDNKWGWTSMRNADVQRVRGGGYLLNMPRPEPLD